MERDLIDYYKKMGLGYHILSFEENSCIKRLIKNLYIKPNRKYGFSLFDILKIEEAVAVNFADSWNWIHDFIKDKNIIVFFDYQGEYIELANGSVFVDFYSDCPKDEFYLTDLCGTFLLGYNHSKCLFAMGTAADWLEQDEKYMNFLEK